MDNNYTESSARDLIAKILQSGVNINYEEIISFLTTNQDNPETDYVIKAIKHAKESSILLELYIEEYELHQLLKYLTNSNINNYSSINHCIEATKDFLKVSDDGLIHFNSDNIPNDYYEITPELLSKIVFDNTNLPPHGQTKTYHERIIYERDGQKYESTRQFEIDEHGRALRILHEDIVNLCENPNHEKPTTVDDATIYGGILGDLLLNLNNKNEK